MADPGHQDRPDNHNPPGTPGHRGKREEDRMSGVVDVGEAFELTFSAEPGQTVTTSFLDPAQTTVIDAQVVPESSTTPGNYPQVYTATRSGMWTVVFMGPSQPQSYYVRARDLLGPLPLAAVGDIGDQFGTMTAAQEGLAAHLARAASALLRARAAQAGLSIDADIAVGRLDPELAALTVANMVLRVMRNPDGLRAETTGPFSRTYDTTAAAGLLVVTDYDLAAITTAVAVPDGIAALGIGTIRVVPGMLPDPWYRRHHRLGGPHGW
jgi:hypothetical protein